MYFNVKCFSLWYYKKYNTLILKINLLKTDESEGKNIHGCLKINQTTV